MRTYGSFGGDDSLSAFACVVIKAPLNLFSFPVNDAWFIKASSLFINHNYWCTTQFSRWWLQYMQVAVIYTGDFNTSLCSGASASVRPSNVSVKRLTRESLCQFTGHIMRLLDLLGLATCDLWTSQYFRRLGRDALFSGSGAKKMFVLKPLYNMMFNTGFCFIFL